MKHPPAYEATYHSNVRPKRMAPIPAEDPDNPFDHLAENMAGVDLGSGENMEEALVMDAYKVHRTLSGDQSMASETDPEAPAAIEAPVPPSPSQYGFVCRTPFCDRPLENEVEKTLVFKSEF